MSGSKKVLLSGVKPSGVVHIGNYFGALKQFVDLQDNYRTFIMIADLHALTTLHDPVELRQNVLELTATYLAIGLKPEKVTLFKQSDIMEHTQAAWIFSCLTTVPYLMRAHAFKDAETKNKEVNTGLFTYPILMTADILLYSPDVVPVGQDQKQHLEIARDTAEKFNRVYGELFKLPEPLILEDVKTVIGLDGQKMSKSYRNTIPLFAPERDLRQLVMSIKTDSKGENEPKNPEECSVFALHKFFSQTDLMALKKRYVEGGIGYRESKEILAENMNTYLEPMRKKYEVLIKDEKSLFEILANGANSAREIASVKMAEMRNRVGVGF